MPFPQCLTDLETSGSSGFGMVAHGGCFFLGYLYNSIVCVRGWRTGLGLKFLEAGCEGHRILYFFYLMSVMYIIYPDGKDRT